MHKLTTEEIWQIVDMCDYNYSCLNLQKPFIAIEMHYWYMQEPRAGMVSVL